MPFTDSFMIGIMAQVAQWECEQISRRTKAALAIAKGRGRQIGGDRGNLAAVAPQGRQRSVESRMSAARARNDKIAHHVAQAKAEGFRSVRSIAAYLNRRGIRTSRGKEWKAGSIYRLM
ncbi:recombinase family protein [Sphingosinicella rhizophila]|uniref:recombinase family protein n=1 Tax=Sphingosinicella rhizophila TaxID=3050082 RepID=UPI0028F16F44|nr:recombinase family protein [Sphingosinicella sp. GR2756]